MKITKIPDVIQRALEDNGIKAGVTSVDISQAVDRTTEMVIRLVVIEELEPPITTPWERVVRKIKHDRQTMETKIR